MQDSKKYFKYLDIIRVIFCITIFLYHLGILHGGYLAVCSFFVLSGYLSCNSLFKEEKFSFKKYYLNRLFKIYIPLVIVLFISIFAVSLFRDIVWFNLKPESNSVLFCYNNFWQLGANLDYFARHIDSPFMHLWYISILLQFDLIFPLIFVPLKKIGDKFNKFIPCILTFIIAIISCVAFYIYSEDNIMVAYYNSFLRVFSLLFGVLVGFIHSYYNNCLVYSKIKEKPYSKIVFYFYLVILCVLFFFASASSKYFGLALILTTLITCRLIDYSVLFINCNNLFLDKIIKFLSGISYEIYLVQYPIIFIFQYINFNKYIELFLILIITLITAFIINFSTNKKYKNKPIKIIFRLGIIVVLLLGIYKYVISKDYTEDMKKLENELAENAKILEDRLNNYEINLKKEKEELENALSSFENDEANLDNVLTSMRIVGVGDSVMLGATPELYNKFPNGYFDAKISRTAWKVNDILVNLKNNNKLGDVVIINVGANGDCPDWCKREIMDTVSSQKVFWLNVTNDRDVNVNGRLNAMANDYSNLYVIDWNTISRGHPEYFVADGIHLTPTGRQIYVESIYNSIKEVYLNEFKIKKEELIKNHEIDQKKKVTFYGNDLLVNVIEKINNKDNNIKFIADKEFTYESLNKSISLAIDNDDLNNKIVFVFDSNLKIDNKQYNELIKMCGDREIYILIFDDRNYESLRSDNVKIINFYEEIKNNDNYLMVDKIHLTKSGNEKLGSILTEIFK